MTPLPKILIYHPEAAMYAGLLRERFPGVEPMATSDEGEFRRHLHDTEIILGVTFPVDVLADATRLKWFHCTSAGVDFLMSEIGNLEEIIVTNSRGIHGNNIADYVLGTVLMLHWDFPKILRDQESQLWLSKYVAPISELTLGVIGLGSIGRVVAMRAASSGLRVLGVKRHPSAVEWVEEVFAPAELDCFLPKCDVVVLAVPETSETRRMIGVRQLSLMRSTAFLINIARGRIIDEKALVAALQEGRISGAALDVFEIEPLPQDSPLWSMRNVIVTPHIAGSPARYVERAFEVFADNLARWQSGTELCHVVDIERGY
jgi:phosphoglycerate dehydrogenase-like enzyme